MLQIPPTLDSDRRDAASTGRVRLSTPRLGDYSLETKANTQTSTTNCKVSCQRSQLILSAILKLGDRLTSQTMKAQCIVWRVTHWCKKDGLLGGGEVGESVFEKVWKTADWLFKGKQKKNKTKEKLLKTLNRLSTAQSNNEEGSAPWASAKEDPDSSPYPTKAVPGSFSLHTTQKPGANPPIQQ